MQQTQDTSRSRTNHHDTMQESRTPERALRIRTTHGTAVCQKKKVVQENRRVPSPPRLINASSSFSSGCPNIPNHNSQPLARNSHSVVLPASTHPSTTPTMAIYVNLWRLQKSNKPRHRHGKYSPRPPLRPLLYHNNAPTCSPRHPLPSRLQRLRRPPENPTATQPPRASRAPESCGHHPLASPVSGLARAKAGQSVGATGAKACTPFPAAAAIANRRPAGTGRTAQASKREG